MSYNPVNDYSSTLGTTLGLNLDQEFEAIRAEFNSLAARLAALQRADGRLRNRAVGFDSLSDEVRRMLALTDESFAGPWEPGILLRIGQITSGNSQLWIATTTFYGGATLQADIDMGRLVSLSTGAGGDGGFGIPEVVALPDTPDLVDGAKVVYYDGAAYVWNGTGWAPLASGQSAGVPSVLELPESPDDVGGAQIVRKIPENQFYGWTGSQWLRPTVNGVDIADGTVPAEKIYSIDLRSIAANIGEINAGSLTIDSLGYIRGGQPSFNSGSGFWFGFSGGQYRLSAGNANNDRFKFDQDGMNISGALTINSSAEIQLVSNVNFNNLSDWYDGDGNPSIFPGVYVESNAAVLDLDMAGVSRVAIASKKFAVTGGELLRVTGELNVSNVSPSGFSYCGVSVLFSNNPALLSEIVGTHNAIWEEFVAGGDATLFVQPLDTMFVPFSSVIEVPPGMVWASILLQGEVT